MLMDPNSITNNAQTAFSVSPRAGDQLETLESTSVPHKMSHKPTCTENGAELGKSTDLSLTLSLQINHTHIHNGSKVCEGFHGLHIGAILIWIHIQLQRK